MEHYHHGSLPQVCQVRDVQGRPQRFFQHIRLPCLLPLNILNEKIFAFLWIWFILVAMLISLKFLYRLATVLYPGMRLQLLRARARFMPKKHLQVALRNCSFGDWFVLMRVGNNISPELFRKLLEELYEAQSLIKIPPGADKI